MREIKFRAWFKKDDALHSGMYEVSKISTKAIIGGIWSNIREVGLFSPKHGLKGNGFELTVLENEVELMQYTGLKDKNGKEIYEGDIIKCSYCDKDFGKVYWYESGVSFRLEWSDENCGNARLTDIDDWCEVVGNIYENPELLSNNLLKSDEK